MSLEQQIESSGKRAGGGHSVRLVDIPADAGVGLGLFENLHGAETPAVFAERIAASSQRYYGTPLAAFLEFVADYKGFAMGRVQKVQERFIKDRESVDCPGEVHRVLGACGLVAGAGELAIELRILPWPRGEAVEAAGKCIQDWLSARGGAGGADLQRAIRKLRHFLLAEAARFHDLGNRDGQPPYHCAGYKRADGSRTIYYVLPEVFAGEATGGDDPRAVARELDRRGFLKEEGDRLQIKTPRLPGGERPRAYAICGGFLERD